ncbi:MAG: oligosaccharide flippase family protein [Phycisphaerales bacterium]|nr:MAG: oligosaccharide flippase family protein [Phycisphaerales bacterium]
MQSTASVNRRADGCRSATLPHLSLRANFRWTFAGNVVNGASQWGMLAVLARLGSAEMVGQFVLGLAISAPVMAMTMLQLRAVQVTDARGEFGFRDYFGTRISWTLVGVAVIAACAWVGEFDAVTTWVILGVGLTKGVDSVTDIVRGLFQRHERMDYSGTSLMLKGPGALVAMTLLLWWTGNIVAAVAGMAIVWLVSFVAYDLVRAGRLLAERRVLTGETQQLVPRFAWPTMARLSWIALPLGIVMALISLQTNIPRYVLQGYAGTELLGYFGALAYPIVAALLITGALGQSASPRLARYYLNDLAAFRALLRKLLWLALAVGGLFVVGAAILGGPILALLYGPDYAQYHREFVVVAIAGAIQLVASAWGYGLTAARYFRTQVALVVLSCLATTVAAFILVPGGGVMGAAWTVLVTSIAMWICFGTAMLWAVRSGPRAAGAGCTSPATDGGSQVSTD